MAYTLYLPDDWYDKLNEQCRLRGHAFILMCALIMQESSWNPQALGDGGKSYGLGQLQVGAARDAGWTGTDPKELFSPHLNITLTCSYFALCKTWAQLYRPTEVAKYTLNSCALSVYNQGPGNYRDRGIAANKLSYVDRVWRWWSEFMSGGIKRVTGELVPLPEPPTTYPDPETAPVPPDKKILEEITKWADLLRKELQ